MSLQYGVPLEVLVNKFSHTRFDPMGFTKNPDVRYAKSLVDYIFRWMGCQFLSGFREANLGIPQKQKVEGNKLAGDEETVTPPVATKADGHPNSQGATSKTAPTTTVSRTSTNENGHAHENGNGQYGKKSRIASEQFAAHADEDETVISKQFSSFDLDAPSCGQLRVNYGP